MKSSLKTIIEHRETAPGIRILVIEDDEPVVAGQFYMLKNMTGASLLPRPLSVHDCAGGRVSFLYQVIGKGTHEMSQLPVGGKILATGPLGNGFPVETLTGRVALVLGGVGIAPAQILLRQLSRCQVDLFAGFRDEVFGLDNITDLACLEVSTESGRSGKTGYCTDAFSPAGYDAVLACGPTPMMKVVAKLCREEGVPCYLSLENRMACGVGVCLGCTCKTDTGKERTCVEGPVFLADRLTGEDFK